MSSSERNNNIDDTNRLERARGLFPIKDEAAFKTLISLYDEDKDRNNPEWQSMVALAYNLSALPSYDPLKAHAHFLAAANLGWAHPALSIASMWEDGIFGVVDADRALAWYKKAYELGNGEAGYILFQAMKNDPRFNEDRDFRKTASDILWKSANEFRHPVAIFRVATVLCDRGFVGQDFESVRSIYEGLAGDGTKMTMPCFVDASLCLAFRCYLGLGVPHDRAKAATYARQVLATLAPSSSAVVLSRQNTTQRLLHLISQETPDHASLAMVREIHGGKRPLDLLAKQFVDGTAAATWPLANYLWAVSSLAEHEGHDHRGLSTIRRIVEMKLLGVGLDDVVTSTEAFGPLFNKRDQHGYPLPGVPLDTPELKEGVGELVNLTASEGEVQFRFCEPDPKWGPLLTPEDINVALCLAFSEKAPIWPAFTLDPLEPMTPDRPRHDAKVKIWQPSWLANTQLGKTMYAADYWMGRLVWNTRGFGDASTSPWARALLRRIDLCGGKRDGLAGRIMLHPGKFHRTWHPTQDGWQCDIHKMRMAVLGAGMVVRPDGTEDWNVNKNDIRFATGRAASIVTQEYDALCALFPLFERARQLTALVYALNGLREKGFVQSPALRLRVATSKVAILKRAQPPRGKRLILTLEA